MKRRHLFFAVLVTLLVLMAGTAQARRIEYWTGGGYYLPGQTKLPDYKTIIEGSSKSWKIEDYSLTFEEDSEYLTVDADGTVHISADTPVNTRIKMKVLLKPKKSGVSKQTVNLTLYVEAPLEDFRCDPDTLYLMAGTDAQKRFNVIGLEATVYLDQTTVNSGADLVKVTGGSKVGDWVQYRVQPASGGETGVYEATYYAFDGQQATVRVHVLPYATKIEFAEKQISCMLGDTFDMNLDLGIGPNGYEAANNIIRFEMYNDEGSVSSVEGVWIGTTAGTFKALKHGYYKVVASLGQLRDTMYVNIYDDAACQSIAVGDNGMIYPGSNSVKVKCCDASGEYIVRPLRIVDGADIVSLVQDQLTVSGLGKFTLEAQNPDGSVYTQTFEAVDSPTEMTLNAVEVTLDIGQSFALKASFDKGEHPYTIKLGYAPVNEDGLASVRLEGNRIIAQAPGQASVYVTAYGAGGQTLTATCSVTVLDSDLAVHIVLPDPPLGVEQESLITVQDKTGKVYPGTYTAEQNENIVLYPDGKVLGVKTTDGVNFEVTLDDGRVLKNKIKVRKYPKWLKHENLTIVMGKGGKIGPIDSDVGEVYWSEVECTIADTSIVSLDSHIASYLTPKQPGVTTVTLKSIYTDASVTFTIEIVDNEELLADQINVRVPYGYYVNLPQYVDGEGNPITIDWAITYDLPGDGNSESSGFLLEDGALICTWPTASCVVTGRTKDNITIRINATGYLLPESISISPENRKIAGSTLFRVLPDQEGTEVNRTYWQVEDESILTCETVVDGDSNTLKPRDTGTTRVMVMLDNGVYTVFTVTVLDPGNSADALPGDVNVDKTVDNQDALLILQHIAGWGVDIHDFNADVNADGSVTIDDAMLIFQKVGGMKVLLRKYEAEE